MERLIISKKARDGQLLILIVFLAIFIILLLSAILTSNNNYLLIIVFAIIFFGPVYLFSLKLFDIFIQGDCFVVRNLFKEVKIDKLKFEKVVPMKSLFIAGNNPYFTIVFTNGDKYNFVYRKKGLKNFFQSRTSTSKVITNDLLEICK